MYFNRRDFLRIGASTVLSGTAIHRLLANDSRPVFGGWVHTPEAREWFISTHRQPYLTQLCGAIKGTSDGRAVVLWPSYERVRGAKFTPFFQDIGDCTGQASTMAAQVLTTTQIDLHKSNELWKGEYCVETTYAGSRVEIGGGKIAQGDGSTGAWVVEFLRRYGVLLRAKYGDIDLSQYRPDLGRAWGRRGVGVPDVLEPIAKQHPVQTTALVTSWEEAADSVANGYPVILCSSIGYSNQTDKYGFLRQNRVWYHAMFLFGIDRRRGKREGGCIANSWGPDWLSGPRHELGTPDGCFWADAEAIEAAIMQGDCFSLSNFNGFPRRDLDYLLI